MEDLEDPVLVMVVLADLGLEGLGLEDQDLAMVGLEVLGANEDLGVVLEAILEETEVPLVDKILKIMMCFV